MMRSIKRFAPASSLLVLLLAICSCISFALAQNASVGSPVLFNGKTIIIVHWGFSNSTPAVRAHGIATRLKAVAEDPGNPLNITLQPSEIAIDIRCGNVILASVYSGDAQAENTTPEALAQRWSNSFVTAIQDYREKYGWRQALLRSALSLLGMSKARGEPEYGAGFTI